jgi:magnesium transporter
MYARTPHAASLQCIIVAIIIHGLPINGLRRIIAQNGRAMRTRRADATCCVPTSYLLLSIFYFLFSTMTTLHDPVFQSDMSLAPVAMQRRIEHNGLTWVDFLYPGVDQVEYLRSHYPFHQLHLDDLLSRLQRPKIDDNVEEHYSFLVLHFPVFNAQTRLPTVSEIDIFAGNNYIITGHDGRLKALARLVHNAGDPRIKEQLMSRGSGYLLYRIIECLLNTCTPMLYQLDEKLDRLDEQIFKRDVRQLVQELSFLRRDIISMRRIIKPNLPVVRSLAARERSFLNVDEDAYFGDLADSMGKIWDMLEEHKEIIEGLDATLSSLTSHRINTEMKIFTLITVIGMPMTIIGGIYGMNVPLPWQDHPGSLVVALLLMLTVPLGMFLYFRWKGWV